MRFNRRLRPFRAISFDLDDTLYSNRPIMHATESAMTKYFAEHVNEPFSVKQPLNYVFWFKIRSRVLRAQTALQHDVGELRRQTYFSGLVDLGLTSEKAKSLADDAYQYFMHHRCDFTVAEPVHHLLKKLAEKWPLVAISNGNVDTRKIGINQYFSHTYHANLTQAQKPRPDMFENASCALGVATHHILHVGDCGHSDIYGAMAAGCQSAWVSTYDVGKPICVLPDIELNDVTELAVFAGI
ncbi:HAD-IA family hydrolase [Thalassotalea fusca]